MASMITYRRSFDPFTEHFDHEYYQHLMPSNRHHYHQFDSHGHVDAFPSLGQSQLSQPTSVAMAALPDAGCFTMKHTASDLYRIDSGFSLNHYDTASSTYSAFDDRHRSPSASDYPANSPDHLPEFHHLELEDPYMLGHQTIAMPEIQGIADAPMDPGSIDLDLGVYSVPQEGYQPIDEDESGSTSSSSLAAGLVIESPDMRSVESPPIIRQRRPAARANTIRQMSTSSRVSKRNALKRAVTYTSPPAGSDVDDENAPLPRLFHCPLAPYGCESTFGSKNEWKRHFSTQHLRLEYWRCDQCSTINGKKPNDFNRRDLFTQHVRRMHGQPNGTARKARGRLVKSDNVEHEVTAAASRCHRRLRSPPTSSICIICEQAFSGNGSWDDRMEHLGKHFESAKKDASNNTYDLDVDSWTTDVEVERWMVTEGILTPELELGNMVEDSSKD